MLPCPQTPIDAGPGRITSSQRPFRVYLVACEWDSSHLGEGPPQ